MALSQENLQATISYEKLCGGSIIPVAKSGESEQRSTLRTVASVGILDINVACIVFSLPLPKRASESSSPVSHLHAIMTESDRHSTRVLTPPSLPSIPSSPAIVLTPSNAL